MLCAIIEPSQARQAYRCVSGKSVTVVTNHFLIEFYAHCTSSNSSLVLNPAKNSVAGVVIGPSEGSH